MRQTKKLPWLRPDGKSQVTVEYTNGKPSHIPVVVVAAQHDPDISHAQLRKQIIEKVVLPVLPKKLVDKRTVFHINATGKFVIGGPVGDCGLTGRKIIVDTYGGRGRHGGGCFSGKDPTKVDRTASYMARYIAKNIVAARPRRRLRNSTVLRHRLCRPAFGPRRYQGHGQNQRAAN